MISNLIKTIRPRQWTKNLVLFAGIIFDGQLLKLNPFLKVSAAFLVFCLVSGLVYTVNDLMDIQYDRQHSQKRLRPLASGQLSPKTAILFSIFLAIVIFISAFLLSYQFGIVCLIYILLMLAYSRWLKHIVLIDVLTISAGFILRMIAGIMVIKVAYISPWLLLVTSLLALFLGFGKRRAELNLLNDNANEHRKSLTGYTLPLLDQLITVVFSAALITYCLYTFSESNTPNSHPMMLTIPFVLYGMFRYLYLLNVKDHGGAPEEVLLTDRPIQIAIMLWAISVIIILYLI